VERLAVDSAENRVQRARAEAALELTSEELQRSARFSADASHQLKTPVTVLRAGLEELLAGEKLSLEAREEIGSLVHQTFRLTSIIEDLLLLSRMDAGRLQIEFSAVDLTPLIEAWLDDLGALPDGLGLAVETDIPPALWIAGEKRYTTLILQNLLENARKYNRPGGRIRIAAREEGGWVILAIGNTGGPIPPTAQEHIFERFHRGAVGENVPGHGLGLNLARELARLHRGELRLARSDETWTEFEVRFRPAQPAPASAGAPA
jgi:signal transduction histidine kinase